MHMEAKDYVEGQRRGTANLTGSTPGVTHHPASLMVPRFLSYFPYVLTLTKAKCMS